MRPVVVKWLGDLTGLTWLAHLIPSSTVAFAIAASLGQLLFLRRARGTALRASEAPILAFVVALGALGGARLLFTAQSAIQGVPSTPSTHASASFGAYLGGASSLVLACLLMRTSILRAADLAMSCLGIVVCIGRLACFLDGDDFGGVTHSPVAVVFPPGSPAFISQVRGGLLDASSSHSLPVYPVQLYLSLVGLGLFILASWLWRRYGSTPGLTTAAYWCAYFPMRFGIEFLRGDQIKSWYGLSVPQLLSLVLFLPASVGLVACIQRLRRRS